MGATWQERQRTKQLTDEEGMLLGKEHVCYITPSQGKPTYSEPEAEDEDTPRKPHVRTIGLVMATYSSCKHYSEYTGGLGLAIDIAMIPPFSLSSQDYSKQIYHIIS